FRWRGSLGFRRFAACFGRSGLIEQCARVANLLHRSVVLFLKRAGAFGVNVADDPEAMLHVIEGDDAVVEHEHGVVQADIVLQTLRETPDEPHHVVAEVADGTGHERRQLWHAYRAKALHVSAQERNGVAFFPNDAVTALENASSVSVAKNLFGIGAGKRV